MTERFAYSFWFFYHQTGTVSRALTYAASIHIKLFTLANSTVIIRDPYTSQTLLITPITLIPCKFFLILNSRTLRNTFLSFFIIKKWRNTFYTDLFWLGRYLNFAVFYLRVRKLTLILIQKARLFLIFRQFPHLKLQIAVVGSQNPEFYDICLRYARNC